jgi:TonB family protein
MTTSVFLKKNKLFLFCGVIVIGMISSCTDNDAKKVSATTDSSATNTADTTAAKPAAKTKKGKATAMMTTDKTMKVEKGKDGIYINAEVMPQYPGGDAAISKYVSDNINYPQSDLDNNKEGTVKVSFVIDEKGNVVNPVVEGTGLSSGINSEAERIVKQMPVWKPGMVKGKAVKTRLELPITFKINADS